MCYGNYEKKLKVSWVVLLERNNMRTDAWTKKEASRQVFGRVSEWVSQFVNEWVNDWTNERMCVRVRSKRECSIELCDVHRLRFAVCLAKRTKCSKKWINVAIHIIGTNIFIRSVAVYCNRSEPSENLSNTTWLMPTESKKYENRIKKWKKIQRNDYTFEAFNSLSLLRISWSIPCTCIVHTYTAVLQQETKSQCEEKTEQELSHCFCSPGIKRKSLCHLCATNHQSREFTDISTELFKNLLYKNDFVPFLYVILSVDFRSF